MILKIYNVQKHSKFKTYVFNLFIRLFYVTHIINGYVRYGCVSIYDEDVDLTSSYTILLEEVVR